ncbi:MAG: hypothetical protein QOJ11_1702 [Frankiales bacterium]|jgi:hypothetical protein|nr:hypothetical protein [Frankiales bacterium]
MTEPISFEGDIKPLFRERDQRSMKRHFDLWSYDDVKAHADDIFDAVSSGSMPCDDEWPAENVDAFRRWMDSDYPA